MQELPNRPPRAPRDVLNSKCQLAWLNRHQPTTDPAGWQISDTGTVWTEVVANPGTDRESRAQVVAVGRDIYLLALPLCDVEGLYTAEDFATLAGATAYFEGRNRP